MVFCPGQECRRYTCLDGDSRRCVGKWHCRDGHPRRYSEGLFAPFTPSLLVEREHPTSSLYNRIRLSSRLALFRPDSLTIGWCMRFSSRTGPDTIGLERRRKLILKHVFSACLGYQTAFWILGDAYPLILGVLVIPVMVTLFLFVAIEFVNAICTGSLIMLPLLLLLLFSRIGTRLKPMKSTNLCK